MCSLSPAALQLTAHCGCSLLLHHSLKCSKLICCQQILEMTALLLCRLGRALTHKPQTPLLRMLSTNRCGSLVKFFLCEAAEKWCNSNTFSVCVCVWPSCFHYCLSRNHSLEFLLLMARLVVRLQIYIILLLFILFHLIKPICVNTQQAQSATGNKA